MNLVHGVFRDHFCLFFSALQYLFDFMRVLFKFFPALVHRRQERVDAVSRPHLAIDTTELAALASAADFFFFRGVELLVISKHENKCPAFRDRPF